MLEGCFKRYGCQTKEIVISLNCIRGEGRINSKEKALHISRVALDKKAEDIIIMNMKKSSILCDYFVIAGAESSRRVKTISQAIVEGLSKVGVCINHMEGEKEALWVLLDYSDVVVHVFYTKTREFYNLERLWQDAPKEHFMSSFTWQKLLSKKKYPA